MTTSSVFKTKSDQAETELNAIKVPKVSVVIPAYNVGEFLRQCLESILNQSFDDFEIVVVDDASTDDSLNILQEYARQDTRLRVLKNERNMGVSATTNQAIRAARSQYVARMDADDLMCQDRLQKQLDFLEKNPDHVLVGGQVRMINQDGETIRYKKFPIHHDEIISIIFLGMPAQQGAIMVNTARLPHDFVWYREGIKTAEEIELFFKLLKYGKFANLRETVIDYRERANSLSLEDPKETFRLTCLARKRGIKEYGFKPSLMDYMLWQLQIVAVALLPKKMMYPVWYRIRILLMMLTKLRKSLL
jgi:glycosyltransferase involved in cell wall biosynthesis